MKFSSNEKWVIFKFVFVAIFLIGIFAILSQLSYLRDSFDKVVTVKEVKWNMAARDVIVDTDGVEYTLPKVILIKISPGNQYHIKGYKSLGSQIMIVKSIRRKD